MLGKMGYGGRWRQGKCKMLNGQRVPGLHWSGGWRTDGREAVGVAVSDRTSEGDCLGGEPECVSDWRV